MKNVKKALFCIETGDHKYAREFQLNLERSAEINETHTKSVRKPKQEAKNWTKTNRRRLKLT